MLGWKPDVIHVPGVLAPGRYAASGPIPRQHLRLADFVGGRADGALPMLDQDTTKRCVAFAAAEAVYARLCYLGVTPALLDIQASYVMAQRWEQRRARQRRPLEDAGLYPIDMVEVTAEWGGTTLSDTSEATLAEKLDARHATDDVSVIDYQTAASHRITGWRRIQNDSEPSDAVDQSKRFLAAGFPGIVGLDIDADFEGYTGGVYVRSPAHRSRGRHMLSMHGYDDTLRAFLVLNHWGAAWGLSGWCWVSYATMGSTFVADRYHLDAEPLAYEVTP